MTSQQVELLTLLKECGPMTHNSIFEIWQHTKGVAYSGIGNRLRILRRLGWATSLLASEAGELAYKSYGAHDRNLWAITWEGYQALQEKLHE